jgi:hypothetical protein
VRPFWQAHQWFPDADIDLFLREVEQSAGAIEPFILEIAREGQTTGLIVAQRKRERLEWRLGYLTVFAMTVRMVEVVPGGVLGTLGESDAGEAISALVAQLRQGDADMALLKCLDRNGPLLEAARSAPPALSRDVFPEHVIHWVLDLPDSLDAFFKSRSKNTKSNIRKYNNRIEKQFGDAIRIETFRASEELDRAMELMEPIAAQTYQRGIGVGFEDSAELRAVWRLAAARGWLRIDVLFADDRPVAFWAGYIYAGSYLSVHTGYLPELHYVHPGQYLLIKIIEDLCADPDVARLDFGYGEAAYKRNFGSRHFAESTICLMAPSLKGAALNATRAAIFGANHAAKGLLKRLDAFDRVRRALRSRAKKKAEQALDGRARRGGQTNDPGKSGQHDT